MTDDSMRDSQPSHNPSSDDVYEAMEPLEPYTTEELADTLDSSKGLIWSRLKTLVANDKVRVKKPQTDVHIWIRKPPTYECPNYKHENNIWW